MMRGVKPKLFVGSGAKKGGEVERDVEKISQGTCGSCSLLMFGSW